MTYDIHLIPENGDLIILYGISKYKTAVEWLNSFSREIQFTGYVEVWKHNSLIDSVFYNSDLI